MMDRIDLELEKSSPPKHFASLQCNNGLNGLKNIGNTCFLNSVIQCLSNTKPLMEYITSKEYLSDIKSESRGDLMRAFGALLEELWKGNGKVINTIQFKNQMQHCYSRFEGYLQHDAQEFLCCLLEGLHRDINRVLDKPKRLPEISDDLSDEEKAAESWKRYLRSDNSKIVDIFVGSLKSTLKCTVCGYCSTTFEVFWDLPLPLPRTNDGKLTLFQCLDLFTNEEILDGNELPICSKCKCRRKCTKRFLIHKFPEVLVLYLERFSQNNFFRKISIPVEFPVYGLDLSSYASQPQTKPKVYNLYAVANHMGTTTSGHYTAYCKHPYSSLWHQYNDSLVSPQSEGSLISGEAYILFYEQDRTQQH